VDLSKVTSWLVALSCYGLPLIELSSRKISERKKKGELTPEVIKELTTWKKSIGLEDPDDLEYKYFLEGIEALLSRQFTIEDKEVPLSQNLTLGDIVGTELGRKKIYYLSKLGSTLANYLETSQHHLYEATLFWLIIRSMCFNPLIQGIISNPRFYQTGLRDELIPSRDGISRAVVKKWLVYFSLINNNQLDKAKLAILFLYALALEINESIEQRGALKEYVYELCRGFSDRFSISLNAIDFGSLLDCLYSHVNRQIISGYPTGRGHQGLPSKPSVQILEINSTIPLSVLSQIQSYEVQKAIVFGGNR
jgi:hypothetical protein